MTEAEWAAMRLSLVVGCWSALIALVPGVALGWLLARKRFPGKRLLDVVVHAPLVVPPVVTGFLALQLLGKRGLVGSWLDAWFGVQIPFTKAAVVLVCAVMGLPLLVRAVRLSIEMIDRRLEVAAGTLGASPLRVFMTITLPLALPGLLAGFMLAFARSLGEFGATITFAGNVPGQTQTLPLAIVSQMHLPGGDGVAMRLAVVSIILAFGALAGSELITRRVARRLGVAGDD